MLVMPNAASVIATSVLRVSLSRNPACVIRAYTTDVYCGIRQGYLVPGSPVTMRPWRIAMKVESFLYLTYLPIYTPQVSFLILH